ncbi:glycosyltransferase family 4 protein [Candidatus Woesearchaeota archaeon]|nr:glycosyltransferase family 4 protein [Candidatus Woesearchaeota archaeon]
MNILALNWRDITHPRAGGAELNVHEILKRLVKQKHKVTLFCGYYNGAKRHDKIDGINVIRYGNIITVYLWAFIFYIFKLRKEKYDLIFENISGAPWMSMLYSRKPRVTIIYHIVGDIYLKEIFFPVALIAMFIESYLMPLLYRNEKVLAISESSREELSKMGFRNIDMISMGIDRNLKPKLKVKSKYNPIIIHHGRLMNYKRVEILVRLMRLVAKKYKNAQLYIVGKGEAENNLKKLTKELHLEDNIKFFGFVSEKKKLELLQKSWIFITPSYKEGWGIVVLEANACGVPAISFDVPGLRNAIINNKTGYLVKDEDEMLEKTIDLIEDKKTRDKMSREAVKWSKNFDWDKTAKTFLNIVKKL